MVLSQTNVSSNVGKSTPTTSGRQEGVVYDASGKPKSYVTSTGQQVVIGSKSDTTQTRTSSGVSVGEQYSINQTTPSEAFKPTETKYEGASIPALLVGTEQFTPATPTIQKLQSGYVDIARQQSVYAPTITSQQLRNVEASRQAEISRQASIEAKQTSSIPSLLSGTSAFTPQTKTITQINPVTGQRVTQGYYDVQAKQSVYSPEIKQQQLMRIEQEKATPQVLQKLEEQKQTSFGYKALALGGELKKGVESLGESVGAFGYGLTVKAPAYLIEGKYREAKETIIDPKFLEGGLLVGAGMAGAGVFGKTIQKGTELTFMGYGGVAGVKSIIEPTKENVAQALFLATPFEKLKLFPKIEIKGEPKISYKETKKVNVEGQISDIPSSAFRQRQPVKVKYELVEKGLFGSGESIKVVEKFYPEKVVKTETTNFMGKEITKTTTQGILDVKAVEKVFINKEVARTDIVQGVDYLGNVKTLDLLGTQSGVSSVKKEQVLQGTLGVKEGKIVELQPRTVLEQSNIAIASESRLNKIGEKVMRTDIVSESSFLKTDKVGAQIVETRGQTIFTQDVKLAKDIESGLKIEKRNVDIVLGDARKVLPEKETALLSKQEGFKVLEKETGKESGITQLISETKKNPKLKSELILKYDVSGVIKEASGVEKKVFEISGKKERPSEVNIAYNNLRKDVTGKSKELVKDLGDDLRNTQQQITKLLPKKESFKKSVVEVEKLNIPSSQIKYSEPILISETTIIKPVNIPKIKSVSETKTIYDEIKQQLGKAETKTLQKPRIVTENKSETINISKPLQIIRSVNKQNVLFKQEVSQQQLLKQEQFVKQEKLQEFKQERLIDKFKFENKKFELKIPRYEIPIIKKPVLSKQVFKSDNYVVEVGRKGKTKLYKQKSFGSLYEAEKFLRGELKGTLSASGVIKTSTGKTLDINLGEEFIPSKTEAGRIVQKAKYRLSSAGEKAQIRGFRI